MTTVEQFIPTAEIRRAVSGRELDVLAELGIACTAGSQHINCPYPTHADRHPSWRWDATRSDSIFDVIMKMRQVGFEQVFCAQIIGRNDLVKQRTSSGHSYFHATSLLEPEPENRSDDLAWGYLGNRLGVDPTCVLRPSTKVVGIKQLAYFDTPIQRGRKALWVGDFPAAVFETIDRDGRRHAQRIYLANGGSGKAELGLMPDGTKRDPKKSARKIGNENTSGRSVIWGDPSRASTQIICEGIETAVAVALAFQKEISTGDHAVAACITAGGIEAFKPWAALSALIVMSNPKTAAPHRGGGRLPHGILHNQIAQRSALLLPFQACPVKTSIGWMCLGETASMQCAQEF